MTPKNIKCEYCGNLYFDEFDSEIPMCHTCWKTYWDQYWKNWNQGQIDAHEYHLSRKDCQEEY